MNIAALREAYGSGQLSPERVIVDIYRSIAQHGAAPVWITLVPEAQATARAAALASADQAGLPLFGVPFAVKDNIDVAGLPTSAGCPAFAYTPAMSATVVARLEAAGAVLVGKTNMDQFATGLVGTRSPYGTPTCVFNPRYISGGSSSGSAIAVASGLVSFALGTDTAGSGRVPAAFNNLVGHKPTRGLLSTAGVVPACRTLDCVSIFAETAGDAAAVFAVAEAPDAGDAFSRSAPVGAGAAPWFGTGGFRFGVPPAAQQEFGGEAENATLFAAAIREMQAIGGTPVEIDLEPFLDAARLLYGGPWVAERYAAIGPFLEEHGAEMNPIVREIIAAGASYTAADAFRGQYELAAIRSRCNQVWREVDLMLLPTVPRAFTVAEIAAQPIALNSQLGLYTNFVNLLDLAAVAVPAGQRSDGLPFGVSVIAPAFTDAALLRVADRLQRRYPAALGGSQRLLRETPALQPASPPPGCLQMAVVGAHLTGQPLNRQLTERGGRLQRTCRTHPDYRLYALKDTVPAKPGLVWEPGFVGPCIEVEVWALPADTVGSFVEGVPPPLTIGNIRLEDGSLVKGFLAEPAAIAGATEITRLGGWRNYLDESRAKS